MPSKGPNFELRRIDQIYCECGTQLSSTQKYASCYACRANPRNQLHWMRDRDRARHDAQREAHRERNERRRKRGMDIK